MLYVTVDYQAGFAPALSAAAYTAVNRDLQALLEKSDPALKPLLAKYPGYELLRPEFSFSAFAESRVATLGAAVAPTLLKPAVAAPADFDSFWAAQLARLRGIPPDPVLTPMPTSQPGVKLFRVRLDSVSSHVQGYLAIPDRRGRFPALIIYQWAGVYALDPAWATDRAAEGWLTFDVDSHDLPPEQRTGVPIDYAALGDHSRDTSYFLDMYLRDTRALQYIRSSPRWDGRTVVLTGTSMGGQQSLVTAGLNPGKVTAVLVNEPAGAGSNGDLHGRRAGYPNWNSGDPQVMRTALYFDTVDFAPHITAATLIAMGFIDTTAPPVGIWTALDEIPGPKEAVPMIESEHNNLTPDKQDAWLHRSEEVLATIVHGGRFIPNEALTRRGWP
jgi:cephalosporin-C deacetylase-like acetyl esterase